jgi:hypothetical protein
MPKSGDVLFYKDFEFEDRSKSNKLFIVLCSDSYCLVLKTTSDNLGFYQGVKQGCNPQRKVFFIPKEEKEGFPLDTYVQFPHLIEISIPELLRGGISRKIEIMSQPISSKCLRMILDCLKYFKDDISPEHWEQIFSGVPNTPSTDSLKELALKFKTR